MHSPRPKNLNLFTIHFPVPAIVSILHRISGIVLFLLIPFMLWALDFSFTQEGFEAIKNWSDQIYVKMIFWVLLIPFCYHVVAGIRHLLCDIHIGETLKTGRVTAFLTFVITAVLIILAGIWLW